MRSIRSLSSPFAAWLTYHCYKAWCSTLKFSFANQEELFTIWNGGSPFILALWHDELFPSIFVPQYLDDFKLMTVASQSKDGEFITAVLQRLGYVVARGSSSRGGLRALLHMAHEMQKEKICPAITVDGPKGPRHKVKDGIFFLAHKAQAPIIPMRCRLSRAKVFHKAWDHFQLPLPFSKVHVRFGQPICVVTEKMDEPFLVQARAELESALNLPF